MYFGNTLFSGDFFSGLKVSPYFAFFLNHKIQIGVGILGFERYIAQSAGHDAWVAIII
ncbi:TPA: GerAB/ArcD/ProY family transporter, partial [Escherichia coli]|nr:GerAB/ArcD/ProY family transporter [Escherichia coli]